MSRSQIFRQPSIKKGWEAYCRLVLGKEASIETEEYRMAFYTGAVVIFEAVIRGLSAGDEATNQDMKLMMTLQKEMDEFTRTFDQEVLKRRSKREAQ